MVQETGENNLISKLDSNSVLIDIYGSNNKIDIIDNQNIKNLTVKVIGNNNIAIIKVALHGGERIIKEQEILEKDFSGCKMICLK